MPSSAFLRLPISPLFPYTTLFRSEDFDLPLQTGVHSPLENSVANGGLGVDLVNNLLESGDRTRFFHIGLFGLPVLDSLFDLPPISKDRKSTRLNSSHLGISYAVFCFSATPNISTLSLHDALPI